MTRLLAVIAAIVLATACNKKEEAPSTSSTSSKPTDSARFDIKVTENGFEPADVSVPAGKPVTLVFERKTEKTCAKEVVLTLDDGKKIEKQLPMNTPVEVATTFPKAGKLGYACGMNMITGTITVQ